VFATAGTLELNRETVGAASDAELLDAVRLIHEGRREFDVLEAAVLAELDARGTTDRELGVRTATWMAREFPHVLFERFVDDVIVHCVSEQ